MKAWESGYAVRWAQTATFHRYLTGTTFNTTIGTESMVHNNGIYNVTNATYSQSQTMPWGDYASNSEGNTHGTHSGTTDFSVNGFKYWLIPKYHGPACELKRCPVSNNNRYGVWLECNGQGTCDSNTGRCECSYKWYMPNCAKKRCPQDPKTGKVCGGKGFCDSKTGLCECNRDAANGLEYPVDHYPWYAVTGTRWNNYGTTDSSYSSMLHSKDADTGARFGASGGPAVVRAGDMHSVGQQEVMKAWESGYAVRWAQTATFHRYLTGTTFNTTAGTYEQTMPWGDYASNSEGNTHGTHSGTTDFSMNGFKYWLIPKYHGPACELK